MSGNVKKSLEKKINVEEIINKLLKASRLDINKFAAETGNTVDALRKSKSRNVLSEDIVRNILDTYDMNEGFLTGEDEQLDFKGKHASVQKGLALPENTDREEVYRTIVEGHTEYYLVPKLIFREKYILVAAEQREQDKNTFNRLLDMFERTLAQRESEAKSQGAKNTKQGS
jgi:hypothetical protein